MENSCEWEGGLSPYAASRRCARGQGAQRKHMVLGSGRARMAQSGEPLVSPGGGRAGGRERKHREEAGWGQVQTFSKKAVPPSQHLSRLHTENLPPLCSRTDVPDVFPNFPEPCSPWLQAPVPCPPPTHSDLMSTANRFTLTHLGLSSN